MKNGPLLLPQANTLPEESFWPLVPIVEIADEWTILRCASDQTQELAEELRDQGLIAWAPMVRIQKRLPRKRKTEIITKPLLPSFVFVGKKHCHNAMELARKGRVHQCKWFLVNSREVDIPSIQLMPLYLAQVRGTLRKEPLVKGDRVEILATALYLIKGSVVRGPMRDSTYEIELDEHKQLLIFPGFLLRKTST